MQKRGFASASNHLRLREIISLKDPCAYIIPPFILLLVLARPRTQLSSGRAHGRSFSLLFRINSQGSTLVREARKVTLLTGHAAAETHDRLTHAVAALHAFSRRRRGRPNTHPRQKKTPPHYKNDPAPSPPRRPRPGKSNDPDPTSAHASGESQHTNRHFGVPSQSPMMSTSSPLSHSMSTDDGSLEDAVNNYAGDHGCVGSAAMEAAVAAAAAAEIAAQAAAKASAAAAAAAAAARSAALSAEGAAHTETSSIAEALEEIRTTLAAGRKDAAGVGAEVERVAAGVGLAPALLGALRALGTEGSGALGDERAAGRAAQLVAEVSPDEMHVPTHCAYAFVCVRCVSYTGRYTCGLNAEIDPWHYVCDRT